MSLKRALFALLAASLVLLAVAPARGATSSDLVIPYQGKLGDRTGQPVADGVYGFAFALYGSEMGDKPLWSERQENVRVSNGTFFTSLGSIDPIPVAILGGDRTLWLAVGVRGPDEAGFTALVPRQRLSASPPAMLTSPANGAACPHDHFGEMWSGSAGVGLSVTNFGGWGLSATTGPDTAVRGNSESGYGVYGESGTNVGVEGYSAGMFGVRGQSDSGVGVVGHSVTGAGVYGESTQGASVSGYSELGTGVRGESVSNYGVQAESRDNRALYAYSSYATAVYGETGGDWSYNSGVYGKATQDHANGVTGWNTLAGVGVYGYSNGGYAGYFNGQMYVSGVIWKAGGGFKIDHPSDPANQYLYHSFVESPEMKNVYDGVAVLDAEGMAWIELPDWFEAVNKEFRYQLTPIGAPAPGLYVAQEIESNRFRIAGGTPGLRVSWQVTGIRHDPYAAAHPMPVEQVKPSDEQGTYLHPIEHGQPLTQGLDYQQNRPQAESDAGGER